MFGGLAPTAEALVASCALQGMRGALLTPGSLAIIQASFAAGNRARADRTPRLEFENLAFVVVR
jgi:hypothetical protein